MFLITENNGTRQEMGTSDNTQEGKHACMHCDWSYANEETKSFENFLPMQCAHSKFL